VNDLALRRGPRQRKKENSGNKKSGPPPGPTLNTESYENLWLPDIAGLGESGNAFPGRTGAIFFWGAFPGCPFEPNPSFTKP